MSIDDKVIRDWRRDIQGDEAVYPGYRQKLLLLLDEIERLRKENAELSDLLGKYQQAELEALRLVKAKLAKAVEALSRLKQTLTIPAAEYVPAIPDAWDIIDAVLEELGQ